jgi:hypothetical protein
MLANAIGWLSEAVALGRLPGSGKGGQGLGGPRRRDACATPRKEAGCSSSWRSRCGRAARRRTSPSASTSRRLGPVVGSSPAERGARRATAPLGSAQYGGGVTPPSPWVGRAVGMTRTDNKPLLRNRSAARSALLGEPTGCAHRSLPQKRSCGHAFAAAASDRYSVAKCASSVPLIADFVLPAERPVIEADGGHTSSGDVQMSALTPYSLKILLLPWTYT